MDYLIPVCLALLGLLAIFTPNWLIPVFIVVGGMAGGTCLGLALANDFFTFT